MNNNPLTLFELGELAVIRNIINANYPMDINLIKRVINQLEMLPETVRKEITTDLKDGTFGALSDRIPRWWYQF